MIGVSDLGALNATSVAAFLFYLISAGIYAGSKRWTKAFFMAVCSIVPFAMVVIMREVCIMWCVSFDAMWVAIASLKIIMSIAAGALVCCLQFIPCRIPLTIPSIFAGGMTACAGIVWASIELMQRI